MWRNAAQPPQPRSPLTQHPPQLQRRPEAGRALVGSARGRGSLVAPALSLHAALLSVSRAMQQRHGFGGHGGELRVSLPRVGGPAPAPLSGKRTRGGPASWVVPLPAALALLALLAVVFQYQLLQCINEADRLVRPSAR